MAGLVTAIHDFLCGVENKQSVDGRHKAGHDDIGGGKGFGKRVRYRT
jgi:hypothetical protein